jgi:hypothetical protein
MHSPRKIANLLDKRLQAWRSLVAPDDAHELEVNPGISDSSHRGIGFGGVMESDIAALWRLCREVWRCD